MEGSGSATIKYRSPSQAPRGRGNLSKQKPHQSQNSMVNPNSNVEKRKSKNEKQKTKNEKPTNFTLTEYRKTKKQTNFTLLIYLKVSCNPKQGFQPNSCLHLICSHWICNVKAKDEVSSDSLLSKPGIQGLDLVLRTSRIRWFGHVEHSTGWIAKVRNLNVVAQKRPGRPKKT